ncbi:putative aminoadipate-semialdehyde dehydrogenase [Nemania sp. NC0429]|nr:putative aminoadipate-semialdehyde dehydrogenase [Nemania sp. NC0429]
MAPRTVMSLEEIDEPTLSNIAKSCDIPKDLIVDVYGCTPMQLAMIAETRAEVLHFILSFGPTADIDRFCQSIRQVVSTNSILRTRIVECSLGIVQVVTSEEHVTEHLSGDVEQYLDDDRTRRVGLGTVLFRTAFVDRVFVATIHHAVMDYVSVAALLGKDLPAAYYGFAPNPRPAFKQFVAHCMNIDQAAARSFWASRLKGAPAVFPRVEKDVIPAPLERAGSMIRLTQTGNAIFQTHVPYYIEAAWALTAATYTASDNVVYGYVLSGRSPTLEGAESTLGPTIAEVPVQVNLQRNMTVEWLLKDRAATLRQLQMHPASQYGITAIGAINESARIASGFQTLLNIVPVLPMSSEEAGVKYDGVIWRGGSFALQLVCRIRDDGISVEPRCDPALLPDSQLRRILNQFEHTLQWLVKVPQSTKLDELPLLNDHDRSEILSWNKIVPEPTEDCLHELFRARARSQPEAMAVESSDGNASYSRLDQMSDHIAYELHKRGVSPEQPVAFIFEKSLWAIVAILGIVKAGGFCIPIDPDERYDRKAAILSLAKANIILTSSMEHANATSLAPDVLVISPDFATARPELGIPEDLGLLSSSLSPENLAYMICTGGSTRTPQGVLLEHRSLASSLTWNAQRLNWGPESRILQFAPYASSASIMEIFGALLFGGCLCIAAGDACGGLAPKSKLELELPRSLASVKANWAMLPPSVLRAVSPNQVPGLRWLASVGEPIDADASERWGVDRRFFNCWGACGASVWSTVAELGPLCPHPESNIGRPVGCAVWIVNPRDPHQLCPIGAVGELWIEGPGVARGFLKSEEAETTMGSFISAPPPWVAAFKRNGKGARLYRTGDLGRYNPDGSIFFVGRQANQVKSAGQKLQVEEIERALTSCGDVEDVAVLAKISGGRTQLVAVVCLAGGGGGGSGGPATMTVLQELDGIFSEAVEQRLDVIREYARSRLPSSMVPTLWLAVERLPRSRSGKLERALISTWLRTRPK